MTEFYIHRFVNRFRERLAIKRKLRELEEEMTLRNKALQMGDMDSEILEAKIVDLKGSFRYKKRKIKAGSSIEQYKNKQIKASKHYGHFSFSEECLVWKAKLNAQVNKGRVFLSRIREVGISGNGQIWFVSVSRWNLC